MRLKHILPVLIVTLLMLGCLTLFPPAKYEPTERHIPGQSQYHLESKVGWYELKDGPRLMLTWRPQGGLMVLNFDDHEHQKMLPVDSKNFFWYRGEDSLKVNFNTAIDKVQSFQWEDRTGHIHHAHILQNPPYRQKQLHYRNGNVELVGTLLIPVDEILDTSSARSSALELIEPEGPILSKFL